MDQQAAVLRLTRVTYATGMQPSQFTLQVQASGENTTLNTTLLAPGASVDADEMLTAQVAPPAGAFGIAVTAQVSANLGGMPVQGTGNTTYFVQPGGMPQTYHLTVSLTPPVGPTVQVTLEMVGVFRVVPYCWTYPECLCDRHYYLPVYYGWLCAGRGYPTFTTLTPVAAIDTLMQQKAPLFQTLSTEMALPYTANTDFFARLGTSLDVITAATDKASQITLRRNFQVSDIYDTFEGYIMDYVGQVSFYPEILPYPSPLCNKWRTLLDCFCRICAQWAVMPVEVQTEFNTSIAPHIDALHHEVITATTTEVLPYNYYNPALVDQCAKLRNIVSFFNYWCRRCYYESPVSLPAFEQYYVIFYPSLQLMQSLLQAANITICNPPLKDFCPRWKSLLDCLAKLCANRAYLPQSIVDDLFTTFNTVLRNLYPQVFRQQLLRSNDVAGMCTAVADFLKYYNTYICNSNAVPGGILQRQYLESQLLILEAKLAAFKSRNTDLCADSVAMTDCSDWTAILDCLNNVCQHSADLPGDVASAFVAAFASGIDGLYWQMSNLAPGSASGSVAMLCSRLQAVRDYIESRCPGSVDPIVLLKLKSTLPGLRSAWNTFTGTYAGICSTSVTIPPGYCDDWFAVLGCLKRICSARYRLNADVLDAVIDQFSHVISYLYWFIVRPAGTYTDPGRLSIATLCAELDSIMAYLNTICPSGSVDPVRKLVLDRQLAALQDAYAALLEIYPAICSSGDDLCDGWVDMLDCLARLCDAHATLEQDAHTSGVISGMVSNLASPANNLYLTIFGDPITGSFSTARDKLCAILHAALDWFVTQCTCGGAIGESQRAGLETSLEIFQDFYAQLRPCPCVSYSPCPDIPDDCRTTQLTLTTGVAPWIVTLSANGGTVPRPANTLTAGGGGTYNGSSWISGINTYSNGQIGWTHFQRCFCLDRDAQVEVVLSFQADDRASVYLDSVLIGQCALPGTGSLDVSRFLTRGRHCIEIWVENNPAVNMGLDAAGYVRDVLGGLLTEACCDEGTGNRVTDGHYSSLFDAQGVVAINNICCDGVIDCEPLRLLPLYAQLFCCDAQESLYEITAWLSEAEQFLPQLILQLGLDPLTTVAGGFDFCSRLRHVSRVMILAYTQPRAIRAISRYRLRCLYGELRTIVAAYAISIQNDPPPCDIYTQSCGRWIDMLACLCTLCSNGGIDANAPIAGQIASLFNYVTTLSTPIAIGIEFQGEVPNLCEMVWWCMCYFSMQCLECSPITQSAPGFDESHYTPFHNAFAAYQAVLGAQHIGCADTTCDDWTPILECLVKLGLRKQELPGTIRTLIDSSFTGLVGSLDSALWQAGGLVYTVPLSNPVPLTHDDLTWKIIEIRRAFYWLCSPYYVWDPTLKATLQTLLPGFKSAYATLTAQLAKNWVTICNQSDDTCGIYAEIAALYAKLCTTAPDTNVAPVQAVNQAIQHLATEIAAIKTQLRITVSAPVSPSFCQALAFDLRVISAAYTRFNELAPQHQLMIRLFMSVLRRQAALYAAPALPPAPQSLTAADQFKADWMELLDCLCRICGASASLAGSAPAALTLLNGPTGTAAITPLYNDIVGIPGVQIGLAAGFSIPLIADPCIDSSICRKVNVLMSFFTAFCLDCGGTLDTAHQTVATQLAGTRLQALRDLLVALRGILEQQGAAVCAEDPDRDLAVQSDHLYLQAAGSDGSDGSVPGVHLRWDLLNKLKDHLPKGNMAAPGSPYHATYGLNRPNDFVNVYRAPYDSTTMRKLVVDLIGRAPDGINTGRREWRYDNLVADQDFPAAKSTLFVRFEKIPYDAASLGRNWKTQFAAIVQAYTGILEVRVLEKTMFAVEIEAGGNPAVKVEARSNIAVNDDVLPIVSHRKVYNGVGPHYVLSEGMKALRFNCAGGYARVLRVQTYEDFYRATKRRYGWTRLGDYALTLSETEAFGRLENAANYPIDSRWPHFEPGTVQGAGKVRAANYRDRWRPGSDPNCNHTTEPDPTAGDPIRSLSGGVGKYLDLSKDSTGWEAMVTLYSKDHDQGANKDHAAIDLSLLKMLKLTARDFHIARMLGLGTIDWQVGTVPANFAKQYVYMAEYSTVNAGTTPDGSAIPKVVHRYLSLPTAPANPRLPVTPAISGFDLGLPPYDQFTEPTTDADGYAKFGDARFVRINKADLKFDRSTPWTDASDVGDGFFEDPTPYSHGDNTKPISYGIRHMTRVGNGTYGTAWERPEISNDQGEYENVNYHPYLDAGGNAETIPIPDKDNPLLVHRITPRADHQPFGYKYAIYGVNWFSRPSAQPQTYGTEVYTRFRTRNTLIAPSNATALYIQSEDPRLFNSDFEQNHGLLHDKTRITFDWNQVHNLAYRAEIPTLAIKLEFFFRTDMPLGVRGEIESVDETDTMAVITTTFYLDNTAENPANVTIAPHIDPADAVKFVGSLFVTAKHSYPIISVDATDPNKPVIKVQKVFQADNSAPGAGSLVAPAKGEGWLVMENLRVKENWQQIANATLPLVTFSSYTEPKLQDDGRTIDQYIGGITGQATITEEWERFGPGPSYGQPNPGVPSGVYRITFGTNVLPPYTTLVNPADVGSAIVKEAHNGPVLHRVEWYKGTLRVDEDATPGRKKTLEVIRIDAGADPLDLTAPTTIYVYDPDYLVSGSLIMPRAIGASKQISVNFHPGYRVYIDPQAGGITTSQILPQGKDVSRETLIAIRAFDSSTPSLSTPVQNASALTPPVLQLARQILEPLPPEMPDGPVFATRPDVYGKSTYTFDTLVRVTSHVPARVPQVAPYAMMFYRADELAILRSLYTDATIETILANLPVRDTDPAFNDRWHGLVNATLETTGGFVAYGTGGSAYTFPNPDKSTFTYVEYDTNGDRVDITPFPWGPGPVDIPTRKKQLLLALKVAYLPLTEQPVLLDLVTDDTPLLATHPEEVLQTSGRKPVMRDSNGKLLPFNDPDFDPYPMLKKVAVGADWKLRFTDYTLDGASKNFYFYCTTELSNTMKVGPASPVFGPVRLVNTMPASAPEVRRVTTRLADPANSITPGVVFEVGSYPADQGITKARLYWTVNVEDSRSVRTMTPVTPDYAYPANGIITHSFTTLNAIYGTPIYYKIAALRKIINERGAEEYVSSLASPTMMVTLMDIGTPPAPQITTDNTPDFTALTLVWGRTAYNATYYLYMQNDLDQWVKIYQVKSNATQMDFTFDHELPKLDDDNNEIFYSFKVVVENTAGLLSEDSPASILTI